MAKLEQEPQRIYQLKITLKHTRPPIWRRIQVPGDFDLLDLHEIIQGSMGWENCHLFNFEVRGLRYEDDAEAGDPSIKDAYDTSVSDAFPRKGIKGTYTYDFGDDWEHEVLVEGVIDPEPGTKYPVCVDGRGSCPPEDCGGVGGYYRLLDILKDPTHEEHEYMVEWVGDDWDPETFDCDYVNRRMPSRKAIVKADGR